MSEWSVIESSATHMTLVNPSSKHYMSRLMINIGATRSQITLDVVDRKTGEVLEEYRRKTSVRVGASIDDIMRVLDKRLDNGTWGCLIRILEQQRD